MSNLSSYAFSPLRDGELILYRGSGQGLPPILLVTSENDSLTCLKRLEHEYTLSADLDAAWAAHPIQFSRHRNRLALVLEDPGGDPLERLLGQPLGMAEFLRIAIPLAWALRQVHARGLIHKDIKPANILVDLASGGVWLTGFGIASRLPRERPSPEPPDAIAGTLAYMAPEQTGRMNRSIDARSDLYSLGVTLYQMLTGTLPFAAADPLEWVHCHIARQPRPPGERAQVPGPLSAIVMKLLAKNAEERYQTASGLGSDLGRCLAQWEAHGRIDEFPLGAHDAMDRLLIPEQLYGREREIDALLAAFDRVVAGATPELVLVSGYSGVGKSSVVNELHKVLVLPRGLFAAGKLDQYKRDIPYTTLAQVFQTLVRQILAKKEAEVAQWRHALREAVGPNGQLMVNLIPEVEFVIGKQPPVAELPPQDEQNRFQMVFRRFLGAFARPEHPLALFLDDLQWLDAATLELLEHLITDPDVRHVLLIGAYRDNEVSPSHPLMRMLAAVRKAGARVQDIVLAPLGLDDLGRLVSDALHCETERAQSLAQLVHEKTAGNPFFAIQFLMALAEEGLFAFDAGAATWTWDLARIHAQRYTDNVVELMVGKLKRLPDTTQETLKQLACLGNTAEIATLALVHTGPEELIHSLLSEAIRVGLILRFEDRYAFLHDRVQEAAYALIPEGARAAAHLRIGRMLASRTAPGELDEHIFEIVNQLNRGAALVEAPEECERIAELDLRAGERAKDSTAYAAALTYFAAGSAMLADDRWARRYDLAFALERNRAECEFLTGDLEVADHRLMTLGALATNTVDRAAVTCLRLALYMTMDRSDLAVAACLEYLRQVGIDWASHPTDGEVRQEYDALWARIGDRPIEAMIDLPLMSDPEQRATLEVLIAVQAQALVTDPNLLALAAGRAANLCLEYGNGEASPGAYTFLGWVLGSYFGEYRSAFQFGKLGLDLIEKSDLLRFRAEVYLFFGYTIITWVKSFREGMDLVRRAFDAAQEAGNLNIASYASACRIICEIFAGDRLAEVQEDSERALEFARKVKFGLVINVLTAQLGLVRTLSGLTTALGSFNEEALDEGQFEAHLEGDPRLAKALFWYRVCKLKACVFSGDFVAASVNATKAQALLSTASGLFEVAEYHFYAALACAGRFAAAPAEERRQCVAALRGHSAKLATWAANCPENVENRAALVQAEIARIEGRDFDAMRFYEEAIRSARANGFIHNEALANELAARFYAARGFEKIARVYLQDARYGYLRWGAEGKVRQLDQFYPHLREAEPTPGSTSTIGAPVEQLDLGTVVKASQAVSGEIEFGKLTEALLRIAVEHAGAERGVLILFRGDELRIEAEATTGRGAVEVTLRHTEVTPTELPESVLHTAIRTRESVILDDAAASALFSADVYVQQRRPRSVLCLPLVKQAKLVGALYLENNLTPHAFTPGRIAVLELLASQAAISLENAVLYSNLQQAEEGLRRSESYLSEAQRLSHTGSFGWRPSSGEIYWSEESFRIFELDRATTPTLELIMGQRVHPDDAAAWRQVIERATREGQNFSQEYRLRMPDHRVKHLHVVAHALRNETGDVDFVGAVKDVTEEKWAQAERERLEQRLRQAAKMEAVGRFAGGIAHDFNNILGAILGYGERAQDSLEEQVPARHQVDQIMHAGARGKGLVDRILAFSRSAMGERVPLQVQSVVEETLDLLTASVPAGVRLEKQLDAGDTAIMGDSTQLHQVVMNLCTNAVDAMDASGVLTVVLEHVVVDESRLLTHGAMSAGGYLRLSVSDTGSGIPPAVLERMFDPFFTTKRVGDGTGLGLALVHGIVAEFGGVIDVVTQINVGTTFTIWLPVTTQKPRLLVSPVGELPRGKGETLMIVDDDRALVALAEETLAELGYEPVGFDSSLAALEAFRAEPKRFDLVLTDETMPDLTGTELAREIRQFRPTISIILMSGYSGAQLSERALAAGCIDVLRKPLVRRDIAEPVARALHAADD